MNEPDHPPSNALHSRAAAAGAREADVPEGNAPDRDAPEGGGAGGGATEGKDAGTDVTKGDNAEACLAGAGDAEADDTEGGDTDAAGSDDEPAGAALDVRRRRLLYRATHRGTFENDLMIGGFVRVHVASLTEADVLALEAVMRIPDTDLAEWLTGRQPIPPEEETPMLRRMREFLAR